MADLIVIEYDDMHKAEEIRLKLQKLQQGYLVDLAVLKPFGLRGEIGLSTSWAQPFDNDL